MALQLTYISPLFLSDIKRGSSSPLDLSLLLEKAWLDIFLVDLAIAVYS
jgi:hypothetical protein